MARNNDSARNDLVEFLMHGYRLGHESFATGVLARFARKRNGIASSVAIALVLAFNPIAFAQLQLIPSGVVRAITQQPIRLRHHRIAMERPMPRGAQRSHPLRSSPEAAKRLRPALSKPTLLP